MILKKIEGDLKKGLPSAKPRGTNSSKQLRAIWGLASRLGITSTELHMRVESIAGKKSIQLLSSEEAQKIIGDLLSRADPYPLGMKEEAEERVGVTTAQTAFIIDLTRQIGWKLNRVEGLAKKMFGIPQISDLTVRQASGLIEALKAIRNRRAA